MSKKLLVLAASKYQIPTILTAKQLGYTVITTDNIANNPGHALADKSYTVSTTDVQGVLEIAREAQIDGIIAPCTDVAVPTAARVAKQLGIPHPVSPECAAIVTNKFAFRQFLQQEQFPLPSNYLATPDFEIGEEFFNHPWIIKPNCSSGSKGTFILNSLIDFNHFFSETAKFSTQGGVILEQFIDGLQGTCEGVLKNGTIAWAVVMDRQTFHAPYTTTSGHHVPSQLPENLQQKLLLQLQAIWNILGVTEGPFDCDFVVKEDEIYILELSPRMGGNSIASLLKQATGFDLVSYSVQQACGITVDLPAFLPIRPTALLLLGTDQAGMLSYNQDAAEALVREDWVDSLCFDMNLGDPVLPFVNSRHRVGEALIYGQDRINLEHNVQNFKQRLRLKAT